MATTTCCVERSNLLHQHFTTLESTYVSLFGAGDQIASLIEDELHVSLRPRDQQLEIQGENEEDVLIAAQCAEKLMALAGKGESIQPSLARTVITLARSGRLSELDGLMSQIIALTHKGAPIRCKTPGQKQYVDAIRRHELTLAIGPAGTGKTYLAVVMAVAALKNREVDRIVLTRPAVEAGEKLGFLPGDMTQKIDPYLRPLYDALYDTMGADAYARLTERGVLEVAPLAFMRGRTLAHSFIILDEAQNTTPEQMKMFLTRIGLGSRCVVTGDVSQIDLPNARMSGLVQAMEVLREETAVGMIRLTEEDVVRHELVRRIVAAYQKYEAARQRS